MKKINLLFGDNDFLIEQSAGKLTSSLEAEVITVDNQDLNQTINMILAQSFFSEKRVFVFKNIFLESQKEEQEKIIDTLKKAPPETWFIFVEKKAPKGKVGDYLKKHATIQSLNKANSLEINRFINEEVARNGGEISPLAVERLASYVGSDYWQLKEGALKLVLYSKSFPENPTIQTAEVDLLVKPNFESNIFELIDAVATKNKRKSLRLLRQFLDAGENEIYILTMLSRQIRNIVLVKFEPKINEDILVKKLGIHPYVAKKSITQARGFDKKEILLLYQNLRSADLALKSGANPATTMENFLLS